MSTPRLGLCLSGGGGRGPAHLGVLQALQQGGIPIHCITGASVGALMAAIYAIDGISGITHEALNRPAEVRALYRDRLRLGDTNPLGKRIAKRLGGINIEELRPYTAICAADVWTREQVVLREGPLLPAVQASVSIPFVAPAVLLGGRYLADPGRERFSAFRAIREMGADLVLEVLLYPSDRIELPPLIGCAAHPVLAWLGRGPQEGTPGRRATLRSAIDLATRPLQAAPRPDITLMPRVPAVPTLAAAGPRRAFRAGYDAGRSVLPALRALIDGREIALLRWR